MTETYSDWLQLWPYAILMTVIASWVLYHFLAPASWRDWASAGLVQAFIIALYAEMYGFPLTIYVLTSFLPIEIPLVHESGHLWATLLGYGRVGAGIEMAIGYALVITGLIMIIKGWVKVYYAGGQLVTDGIYGLVRHPQYTGIFLAIVGQLVHWPTIPTLLLSPAIVLAYGHLARWEERRLIAQFGSAYADYQQHVPMFFPRWQTVRQLLAAS
jgi:protein-S-isoprenylcysteine O-methyltransferase Ste14